MQYSNNILEKYESRPRKWWLYTLIVFIMALLLSWSASSVTFKGFAAKGTEVAKGIFWGLVKPDMNLLFSTSTDGVPYLLMETVCIAILGTVVGGILALPISFLASPKIMPKPVAFIFNALILLIRTLPSIVWALIWIRVTGPGAFCGVITQSICSIGMISNFRKLLEEGIGRLAIVYIVCLFGFIIWIGLFISWLFFHGMTPPLAQ